MNYIKHGCVKTNCRNFINKTFIDENTILLRSAHGVYVNIRIMTSLPPEVVGDVLVFPEL